MKLRARAGWQPSNTWCGTQSAHTRLPFPTPPSQPAIKHLHLHRSLTRVECVEVLADGAAVDAVPLNQAQEHNLGAQDGHDGLGVDKGGLACSTRGGGCKKGAAGQEGGRSDRALDAAAAVGGGGRLPRSDCLMRGTGSPPHHRAGG